MPSSAGLLQQAMPPKVAAASREELQKMLMDTLRKLKRADKRLGELKAENEALQARTGPQENGSAARSQVRPARRAQRGCGCRPG